MSQDNSPPFATPFSSTPSLEDLRKMVTDFATDRDWHQYHTPRNLCLALVGEVGELAECFQWKGEVQPGLKDWSEHEKTHLGEELSDVLLYLIMLSNKCGIDLPAAALRKIGLNGAKYPAAKVRGSDKKYSEYNAEPTGANSNKEETN